MKLIINSFSDGLADAVNRLEIGETRPADTRRRSEMVEKRPFPLDADPRYLIDNRPSDLLGASVAVTADGKTMGLVAQSLQEIQDRILKR